jgi:hypothetical protein
MAHQSSAFNHVSLIYTIFLLWFERFADYLAII